MVSRTLKMEINQMSGRIEIEKSLTTYINLDNI